MNITAVFPMAQSGHTETLQLAVELDYNMVTTDLTFSSKTISS